MGLSTEGKTSSAPANRCNGAGIPNARKTTPPKAAEAAGRATA